MKLPGTATLEENIHIALSKLDIQPGQLFLDIGCGSGAVSAAAARYTDRVFGIDKRPQAVELSRAALPSGQFFCGEAADILPTLPKADRIFIGGTRGLEDFFPLLLDQATPGAVIVADLARLGIAARLAEMMKQAGIFEELIQIHISRGYELAGDIALKPANPIFMVIGRC
jgi:cobalt-precorrin-6B (C15)-methyltransferase